MSTPAGTPWPIMDTLADRYLAAAADGHSALQDLWHPPAGDTLAEVYWTHRVSTWQATEQVRG